MIWFVECFNILSLSRSSTGYGPNHITVTDMISLLEIKRPILSKLLTIEILQLMDSAYLNNYVEKREAKKEAEKENKI